MVVTRENVVVSGSSRRLSSQEIADVLRERIRAGELKAGDRLPTQAELADEFGVERGTVRLALRELQEGGLLSNVSKGSPPRIAEVTPTRNGPQPTMVGLPPRITEAFSVPHVRIDAACLTAETLTLALGEPVRQIHDGRIRPERIDVRILLPSREINLAFPISVAGRGDDDPVHKRWLQQRNAQGHVLRHNLQSLRSSHGIDVHVTFRALPFTPPVKLYLLNQSEALLAYYMIARREEATADDGVLDMFDTLGSASLLFSFEKRAGGRDAAFVDESQKWFNALWETITTDLRLS
ncbi:GntR family transcriptional regulator [Streptomyces rhizosphaerihabitans]|uniref:GntR family transcriptional regulator n=1 Tax=Streptomyces rhizosphaerihabitans TaxID=1266770 RepID=UPI0021BF25A1|nr:winged helix-turn-helix domain-containing protein [Streptomyces rhizosphaerihabitans]MCT9003632.1 winged helix-turn-helix domain-containing protein [Streptomyces rhizosphaerihabitans]